MINDIQPLQLKFQKLLMQAISVTDQFADHVWQPLEEDEPLKFVLDYRTTMLGSSQRIGKTTAIKTLSKAGDLIITRTQNSEFRHVFADLAEGVAILSVADYEHSNNVPNDRVQRNLEVQKKLLPLDSKKFNDGDVAPNTIWIDAVCTMHTGLESRRLLKILRQVIVSGKQRIVVLSEF